MSPRHGFDILRRISRRRSTKLGFLAWFECLNACFHSAVLANGSQDIAYSSSLGVHLRSGDMLLHPIIQIKYFEEHC